MASQRVSADPHEGVRFAGSGFALVPVAAAEISGAEVPCHVRMRMAMAANRSDALFVTEHVSDALAAFFHAMPSVKVLPS
jgi:hypothetical protein